MTPKRAGGGGDDPIRVIPLGGLGEVGMNMMALACGGQALLIDCGQRMPEEDTPGIDMIVPDVSGLLEMEEELVGLVLTHGHEDHIGAIPHVWPDLRVPIYARRLTVALLRDKLKEYGLASQVKIETVQAGEPVSIGHFEVTHVHVTHSISEASALVIRTPGGVVVHSGDYRIDESPLQGKPFDRESLRRVGDKGVTLLLADSTNAEVPGRTASETTLIPEFERIVESARGTVVVGAFSSATHRQRLLFDLAKRVGRTVFIAGRSMNRTVRICRELGIHRVSDAQLGDLREIEEVPPSQRLVLASGTQGEPFSALNTIARAEHRQVRLGDGDTVILSSRFIPGNERKIYRMINHLYRRGVTVHHLPGSRVHISGHAYRDEMRELIDLVRPQHLVPVHGEIRHLLLHRKLGLEAGLDESQIHVLENGEILEVRGDAARRAGDCTVGRVFVDGLGVGDVSDLVLRDRRHLSNDGMVIATVAIDRQTRGLAADPQLFCCGFVEENGTGGIMEECLEILRQEFASMTLEGREESEVVEEDLRRALRRHIRKRLGRRPIVLPIIVEV